MKLIVKADKELFDRWQGLGFKVDHLKAIVQNDMELTVTELNEWCAHATELITELTSLKVLTTRHIMNMPRE